MGRSFNHPACLNPFLYFHQAVKAAVNGEAGKLPLDYTRKPDKSARIEKTDRPECLGRLQDLETGFLKGLLLY